MPFVRISVPGEFAPDLEITDGLAPLHAFMCELFGVPGTPTIAS